jgi:hypothetical protein
MKYYLVEIIRYGDPKLGTSIFGLFDNYELIQPTMFDYNEQRGGKYPAYYVTELDEINNTDCQFPKRTYYTLYEL